MLLRMLPAADSEDGLLHGLLLFYTKIALATEGMATFSKYQISQYLAKIQTRVQYLGFHNT